MALTSQEQNWTSRTLDLAERALVLREDILLHRAEYDQNSISSAVTDGELLANDSFAHLTNAKLVSAVGALDTITTALGDYSTGQAVNLLKLRG